VLHASAGLCDLAGITSPAVVEPARAAQPDFKPHLFGKYFVLQRLAVGGMAEIYRSKMVGADGFEKELALKRILASRSKDQAFIKMLVNEAKLTAQLTHSNIAQIYDCGVVDGTYFIAMELVHGVSMKEMTASFAQAGVTLTPEQAVFIVLQLLHGLDYAHRKIDADGSPLHIVHCDVSPDNALISWEGEVKLLDFGIARAATGLSNYKEGMLMGKLGYVAPEQASLEKTWDHRVDLFAAGIILYELLTKQKPFPRATDVETLVASRKAKVPAPTALDQRIPKDLDAIVARALAWDPDDRYPSARAFADALVDVLFPTPHSAIQELVGQQMKKVFADRIARQRAARAHDALVVKVLQHLVDKDPFDASRLPEPVPELERSLEHTPSVAAPGHVLPVRPPPRARSGRTVGKAFALAALVALLATAGTFAVELWLRPIMLVVTSDPSGALVQVDGQDVPGTTPVVVEGVPALRPVTVSLAASDRRSASLTVNASLGDLVRGRFVRRVHAELPSALGSLVVESVPPGAKVMLDEKPVGTTPATLDGVRLDKRHRIDLLLPGHEMDQFVFLPEKDGRRFRRTLVPSERQPTPLPSGGP
jgi:serine/threonine protein kinase